MVELKDKGKKKGLHLEQKKVKKAQRVQPCQF